MQREMVDVFRDDHVREEAFTGEGLLDGLRRGRGFDHALVTVRARIFGADGLDDDEARRLILELFSHRFPDARFLVAAGALLVGIGHVDLDAVTR